MADPLSITASIIAVVGAAEGVTKTLAKIKSIRNAPDELLPLINEVSDLKIILSDMQNYITQNTQKPQISQQELRNISTLINRAKEKLLELDQLIQYRLVKPESISDQIKVSRREWLRAKSTIEKFRQSLRDIKLNIMAQMMVINSSHQSRIGITINEIHIISGQLQTGQNHAIDRASQQLNEHSRLLADILSSQSNLQGLLQLRNSSDEQARIAEHLPNSVVHIKAHTSQHQRSPCTPFCGCACHNVQAFQSPALLHKVLGTLFIGYSGYPIKVFQQYTEASCVSQSTFRAYVHYVFPSWFLIKALTMTLMSVFLNEISVSLTVRRIVPNGAEIIRLIRNDDVDGVKRLLSIGLASPNDSLDDGRSALTTAVFDRNIETCKLLLKAGADPYLDDFSTRRASAFHHAWNHIFTGTDDPNTLKSLRELFPDKDRALEERGFTRLHKIVLGIVSTNLEQEIQANISDLNDTDSDGFTALIWAARRGDVDAVDLLIEAGADVNKSNNIGSSALSYAVRLLDLRCARALLKAGANSTATDSYGSNALHWAAQYQDNRAVVKTLVEAGTNVNGRNIWGGTPLCYAAINGLAVSAEALLDYGAGINILDKDGDSALYNAIHYSNDVLTQLLLRRGAIYTQIDNIGNSILHPAAASHGLKILEVLFAAKLRGINTEAVNKEGKTASQLVQERVDKPEGFLEKFQELLSDIRTRNAEAVVEESDGGDSELEPDPWWSRYLKRRRSLGTWLTSWTILVWGWVRDLKHAHRFVSRKPLWDPIWIYWSICICSVGILYMYLRPWANRAKEVMGLMWEMAGPGDLKHL